MDFDIKISGGTVVDGTGKPGFKGEVGIRAGKIAEVGPRLGKATETIEADGMVVAPGFVDVHTHYDAQLMWDRMLSISPWHGVTTVVMGNCGFTVAPTRREHRELIMQTLEKVEGMSIEALRSGLGTDWPFETFPEYLDAVERHGTAINVAALVGHTAVRLNVMGEEAAERAATEGEVARMRAIVREAIEAGAIGFSTSASRTHVGFQGKPVASRLADFQEVRALAGALKDAQAGIFQATVGPGLFQDEFAEIYRECGRPVTWTALLTGFFGEATHDQQLAKALELSPGNAKATANLALWAVLRGDSATAERLVAQGNLNEDTRRSIQQQAQQIRLRLQQRSASVAAETTAPARAVAVPAAVSERAGSSNRVASEPRREQRDTRDPQRLPPSMLERFSTATPTTGNTP